MLEQGLEALGITPPEGAVDQLVRYGELLLEQNKVMNLTAITQPDQVATLHFLDSAALLGCASLEGASLVDVGTGAGFPGRVLKILVPGLRLTLVDSLAKRLDWLSSVCAGLGLEGVTLRHARAEELTWEDGWRDAFDFATARAVADLRVLTELCLPYVRPTWPCRPPGASRRWSPPGGRCRCWGDGCGPPSATPSRERRWSGWWSRWRRPPPPPRTIPGAGLRSRRPRSERPPQQGAAQKENFCPFFTNKI